MKNNDKKMAVYGIFSTVSAAEAGVDALRIAGFQSDEISALLPAGDQTKQFAHVKGTKAPEGATFGGTTGAILGGTFGWLVGVGSLAIPGLGPLIAAGPIMAALAGAGMGTAVGALSGALIGLGIPEYEAKRFEGRIKEGGTLVSVHCCSSEKIERAKEILEKNGAEDISSASEGSVDNDETRQDDARRMAV